LNFWLATNTCRPQQGLPKAEFAGQRSELLILVVLKGHRQEVFNVLRAPEGLPSDPPGKSARKTCSTSP
jgi:hypothetical protein